MRRIPGGLPGMRLLVQKTQQSHPSSRSRLCAGFDVKNGVHRTLTIKGQSDRLPEAHHRFARDDRADPRGGRAGRQLGPGAPLLAGRTPHPYRGPRVPAGGLRRGDLFDGVGKIGRELRPRVHGAETLSHDEVRGAVPDREVVAALSRELGWSHFVEIIPLKTSSSATSTPRCAGSNGGASGRSGTRSTACSSSGRPCRGSPTSSPSRSWPGCVRRTGSRRTWSSATPTSSTSWASRTRTARRTSRRPSSGRWSSSSSSSGPASRSSPARSGS